MKTPTTQYQQNIQSQIEINREFLLSQGWILQDEYALFENYFHSKDKDLVCSIGLYGEFSICQLHWCNKTPEKQFTTINPRLTKEDYFKIIDLLNLTNPH